MSMTANRRRPAKMVIPSFPFTMVMFERSWLQSVLVAERIDPLGDSEQPREGIS
jgi:hypothetical protein